MSFLFDLSSTPPLGRPCGYLSSCLVVAALWVTPYGDIILWCRPLMPNFSLSWMSTDSPVIPKLFLVVTSLSWKSRIHQKSSCTVQIN
ncbi:hypothetical protein DPMN_124211 [Dreissena polymorpha]|uniref:Uncharacterized protein n=1 Tax=Dreissena polymorpha TaxID=45954 RepID=A0A9D4GV81_DREPO|nr:hypothetical protein DPMN_124211 [Dreissena polymorpha]